MSFSPLQKKKNIQKNIFKNVMFLGFSYAHSKLKASPEDSYGLHG